MSKLSLIRFESRILPATFMGLGDLTGGVFRSFPNSLSYDGSVIVGSSGMASGNGAFRWTVAYGIQGLSSSTQGNNSEAFGVSADGSVVVGVANSEAFRWTPTTGMEGLGDLPGGDFGSGARAISANGQVVVGGSQAIPDSHAFRWTSSGGMASLGLIAGGTNSFATSISAVGDVISGNADNQAFRWTATTGLIGLGDLPGGPFGSHANAISSNGIVIVGGSVDSFGPQAFRWTQSQGMTSLGPPPNPSYGSNANGVSANGDIIVGNFASTNGDGAFIWTQSEGMRSLRAVLESEFGLANQLAGWVLQSASAISADGNAITGYGLNPNGDTEAWVVYLNSVPNPPRVALTVINEGQAQRSIVKTASIQFDSYVTLPSNPALAFQLRRLHDQELVGLNAVAVNESGRTIVHFSFFGPGTQAGSLANGRYTMTALSNLIDSSKGKLDGNSDGVGGDDFVLASSSAPASPSNIFRIFGDNDGNGDVDNSDFAFFRLAVGSISLMFDYDDDGDVDLGDFFAFRQGYGMLLP